MAKRSYDVTIRATITKTYGVEADSEDEAIEAAHCAFSVRVDDIPEKYEEETLSVKEIEIDES